MILPPTSQIRHKVNNITMPPKDLPPCKLKVLRPYLQRPHVKFNELQKHALSMKVALLIVPNGLSSHENTPAVRFQNLLPAEINMPSHCQLSKIYFAVWSGSFIRFTRQKRIDFAISRYFQNKILIFIVI